MKWLLCILVAISTLAIDVTFAVFAGHAFKDHDLLATLGLSIMGGIVAGNITFMTYQWMNDK